MHAHTQAHSLFMFTLKAVWSVFFCFSYHPISFIQQIISYHLASHVMYTDQYPQTKVSPGSASPQTQTSSFLHVPGQTLLWYTPTKSPCSLFASSQFPHWSLTSRPSFGFFPALETALGAALVQQAFEAYDMDCTPRENTEILSEEEEESSKEVDMDSELPCRGAEKWIRGGICCSDYKWGEKGLWESWDRSNSRTLRF